MGGPRALGGRPVFGGANDVGPRDVIGAPLLPPPAVARAATGLRARLAGLHRGLGPPPVRILEGVLGTLDLAALAALCRLDVPDRLTDRIDITLLADEVGADAQRLARLLRYAASRGWVRTDRRGRVRATAVTRFLRRDHPGGWRAWVEFAAGAEVAGALGNLHHATARDGDAFVAANGAPFFDWMTEHPQRHEAFDAAMDAGGRMHGLVLSRALDWSSSRRVCDVGGGTGALLQVLLDHEPHLNGVLLDLPDVVARAHPHPRLAIAEGDAFEAVPAACDTYLLVNVVHDWPDDSVTRLFQVVALAIAEHAGDREAGAGRIVVVEHDPRSRARDDLVASTDLLMLALTPGGRERDARQLAQLAAPAGLELVRSVRLASGDVAHVFLLLGAGR